MEERKYGKIHYLTDEEKMKIMIDLKERGKIDEVGFKEPLVVNVAPLKKKKHFKPYYHTRDYKSNFYHYMKKQRGFL